jgi:hypothetical protein
LIAFSIGERLIVSNVRDAPPLAKENPGVPIPSDELLYDAAANPDAAHARGVGEGEGDGAGDADGDAEGNAGDGAGGVCAATGTVPRAHAAVKAAMKVRKISPVSCAKKEKAVRARAAHGRVAVVIAAPPKRRALRRRGQRLGDALRACLQRGRRRRQHEPRGDEGEECDQ